VKHTGNWVAVAGHEVFVRADLCGQTIDLMNIYERAGTLPPDYPCPILGQPLFTVRGSRIFCHEQALDLLKGPGTLHRLAQLLRLVDLNSAAFTLFANGDNNDHL
jgi:hypothetical protein